MIGASGGTHQAKYRLPAAAAHAGYVAPPDVLRSAVRKAAGTLPILAVRPIGAGSQNSVHEIVTRDGQRLIVRVSLNGAAGFVRERWALAQCRRAGVPTPDILQVEAVSRDGVVLGVCVETALAGAPLDWLDRFAWGRHRDAGLVKTWLWRVGEVLARIHSIQPQGFGLLDAQGRGPCASWGDWVLPGLDKQQEWREAAANVGLDAALAEQAVEAWRRHAPLFDGVRPSLVHGDFKLEHVLANGAAITGVIDFELCRSGDPAMDFAFWDFLRGRTMPIAWLQAGYTETAVLDEAFCARICLYNIKGSLDVISYYQGHDPRTVERAARRLKRELNRCQKPGWPGAK